ncbi:hypothetical protein [Pseudoxanthomonas koreensis]|uniref:hypothetical protein n=1 Tax=Pseudoxanthomonas koreensis TaxID=266061 RepID=UPI0013909A7A|nr:hypothetical protein [Pseudoxanthomonas koreensis]KAF1692668.1 hypothetical protein CSC64_06680 [Pseudoxanthomonas koreensis]
MSSDYTLRGLDFESYLCGEITDKIIDADRSVRLEWSNGFPNWAMYRTVLAGDSHMRRPVRDWCVAYAVAAAESGIVRAGLPAEEMGALAGWDAYYRLHNARWVIAGQDVADVAGVDPKTYRKLRNYVYAACRASLDEYWVRLQVEVRRVWMRDRHIEAARPVSSMGVGRGFGGEVDPSGNGCYVAMPLPVKGGRGVTSPDLKRIGA